MTRAILIAAAVGAGFAGSVAVSTSKPPSLASQVTTLERTARAATAAASTALQTAGRQGPRGPAGARGDVGVAGVAGIPGTDGAPGDPGALSLGRPIPSGVTITGAWGGRIAIPFAGGKPELTISLPIPAPTALTDADVATNSLGGRCPGSFSAPTASAGTFCLYLGPSLNVAALEATAYAPAPTLGALVRITPAATPAAPTNVLEARGTWAYTAP